MAGRGGWWTGETEVSGFRMHYREWRPGGGEAGLPVLALHGSRMQSGMWRTTAEGLRRWRFVCPDQRAYGRSGDAPGRGFSAASYAEDALGLAGALGLGRFVVMGHSFGCPISLHLAAMAPNRAAAAVLVDPPVVDRETRRRRLEGFYRTQPVEFADLAEAGRFLRKTEEGEWPARNLARFVRDLMVCEDEEGPCRFPFAREHLVGLRSFQASEESDYDPVEIAGSVWCPTLVVRGGRSRRIGAEGAHRLVGALPRGSRADTLPKSGHFPMVAQPRLFRQRLREFLEGVA